MRSSECKMLTTSFDRYSVYDSEMKSTPDIYVVAKKEKDTFIPAIPSLSTILKFLGVTVSALSFFYICQCLCWWFF